MVFSLLVWVLLLDVTLIADFEDGFLRIAKGSPHRISAKFEGDDDEECLNCCDEVEDNDCLFHCGYGCRVDAGWR
jgi:hypothetical protein